MADVSTLRRFIVAIAVVMGLICVSACVTDTPYDNAASACVDYLNVTGPLGGPANSPEQIPKDKVAAAATKAEKAPTTAVPGVNSLTRYARLSAPSMAVPTFPTPTLGFLLAGLRLR